MAQRGTDRRTLKLQVVVMGVTGSGKTTVGDRLAQALGLDYGDADSFHSQANIAKMASGAALTDEDRWPWLEAIGGWLREHESLGAVASCSALKRRYRDKLRQDAPGVWFLHLSGNPELITDRVAHRAHHFMPSSLVGSQFETLQPPGPDERAVSIDSSLPPGQIISEFVATVTGAKPARSTESTSQPSEGAR
ncbi:MAG: gluconokinase [Nocardioidaceae bacterium]